jgi:hypothetical protein
LEVVSSTDPQLCWKKPGSHLGHQMLAAWSMSLDLVAANNRRRGCLTIYRQYSERDLQLDVNLLTSVFPVALADALERTMSQSAVVVATDNTGLMAARAG